MKIIATHIPDLYVVEPTVFGDDRGFFYESYSAEVFKKEGLNYNFVQDNHSKSSYGVLRGLHYQKGIYAQTKLVRVAQGKVIDVVVDIRKGSPTFMHHFSIILSEENKKQLLVPKGFAHGFAVLSETAEFLYKCDQFYNKESEGGIYFADKSLEIDWQIPHDKMIISEKDKINKIASEADFDFPFKEFTQEKLYVQHH